MKRVLVYLNGQVPDKAQFCWATSMDDLNEAVKIKFRLNKPIKFFFTEEGIIVIIEFIRKLKNFFILLV